MRNSDKPIPFGCFVIVLIGVIIYFIFSGEDQEEIERQQTYNTEVENYKSKFNYDIDSIANTIYLNRFIRTQKKVNGKFLILVEQDNKFVINLTRTERLLTEYKSITDLIAYDIQDLNTIIILKYDRVKTSELWANPTVYRDQVELNFYDIKNSEIIYNSTLSGSGNPHVAGRGRTAGQRTYFLNTDRIVNEITQVLEKN
jgi:hypothetical protein